MANGNNITIPPDTLNGINTILRAYGVDLAALLKKADANTEAVSPLVKKYLTTAEAMRYAGLGRWMLWDAARRGKIKVAKMSNTRGGRVLYDRESVEKWIASKIKTPDTHIANSEATATTEGGDHAEA